MRKLFFTAAVLAAAFFASADCASKSDGGGAVPQPAPPADTAAYYHNPVVDRSLPDPSVIKAPDGYFYVYATEDIARTPIFRSKDLVHWVQMGACFTEETRPSWEPDGGIWAPDINYIKGQYVLYYAMSKWGGELTCGVGAATADSPVGPFTDHGPLFRSSTIGVQNSIDPFYMEDGGKKYLIWGSFHGIYCIQLSDDGLSVKVGAQKRQLIGNLTEGSYVCKHDGYYYLFGSMGSCCEGAQSTYQVVVGRSKSLFGPYVDAKGQAMMDGHYELVMRGNASFAGPGHNAEFMQDDAGQDWMLYHAYLRAHPEKGRVLMLDRIEWVNGWPQVAGRVPSTTAAVPVFHH
ncbi:MAG: family 43 glycosylhydrolase [Tannerella sp.]|jgi:arabinan endo-1,5-alpha-L-arabinosidase|nr:family 43 glycosylhydrolase [Tannerella sp.]